MPSGWEHAPEYGSRGGRVSVILSIVAAAVLTFGIATCSVQMSSAQQNQIAGVASVVDGDTIEIHGTRIRLSGFDTPESGARCGNTNVYRAAALALGDFVANRTVRCNPTGSDRYGRTVATCSVNGTDLGDYMVTQGWGRDWPRYSHGAYADEEAAARAAPRGLWALQCPANLWGSRDYNR